MKVDVADQWINIIVFFSFIEQCCCRETELMMLSHVTAGSSLRTAVSCDSLTVGGQVLLLPLLDLLHSLVVRGRRSW